MTTVFNFDKLTCLNISIQIDGVVDLPLVGLNEEEFHSEHTYGQSDKKPH